jgi:hypothetical protein
MEGVVRGNVEVLEDLLLDKKKSESVGSIMYEVEIFLRRLCIIEDLPQGILDDCKKLIRKIENEKK